MYIIIIIIISKMMNLADDTASATYIGAMQEENRLSAAHLLTGINIFYYLFLSLLPGGGTFN